MRKKMVLIGCGSAVFTQGLVSDLISTPAGHKWHLALCDIDQEVLTAIEKLAKKMIALSKADIEISASANRTDLLPGADYVVCTIAVGKREGWEQDVLIPRKYGINQPVGDTAMAGGISRGMRMVPAMLAILRDCEKICPKAHVFNYANPMAISCRALAKASTMPMTGLCHGTPDTIRYMARTAGAPEKEVTARGVGINHLTFIYKLMHKGRDLMPQLREALKSYDLSKFDKNTIDPVMDGRSGEVLGEPFSWAFFQEYGAYPAPGDRHVTEFFTERFPGGKYYGKTLGIDAYSFEGTIKNGDRRHNYSMEIANDPAPLPEDFLERIGGEHEQLMDIIDSIEHDKCEIYYANIPNRGAVPNLPYDTVIELPCVATAQGLRPMQILDFPNVLASIVQKNLSIIEVAADAALQGSVQLFEEAVHMGGYLQDPAAVKAMVAELMEAHKEHLH